VGVVTLDHLIVPARNRVESARLVAQLFDVPWAESGVGPFSPVFISNSLTLDFDEWREPLPVLHFCFRVESSEFDVILGRIKSAGIDFRSSPRGPIDHAINTAHGGKIVYWNEPDNHVWEILTVSYARHAAASG
jgi:hypothetical protein